MSKIAPFRMRNGCAICETLKKPAMLRIVEGLDRSVLSTSAFPYKWVIFYAFAPRHPRKPPKGYTPTFLRVNVHCSIS